MIPIDSQALEEARRALGLGGSGSGALSGVTEFDDSLLQQVADMLPIIRRSRTLAGTEGIFPVNISNVHSGAGTINATIDPFAIASPRAAYPSPILPGFDLWMFQCAMTLTVASTLTSGLFRIGYDSSVIGFGAATDQAIFYAGWDAEASLAGGTFGESGTLGVTSVIQGRPLRVKRGSTFLYSTLVTAAVTARLEMLLGIFPATLGQDVAI